MFCIKLRKLSRISYADHVKSFGTFFCSGARNINDPLGNHFDSSILNNLLLILDSIEQVQSAASLHWFITVFLKVTHLEKLPAIGTKFITKLENLSDELLKNTNPYHTLLRSRYGLFGTPLEPELFDIEPPPPIKPSTFTMTYASVVAGDSSTQQQPTDFHSSFGFSKETLDPKDILSVMKGDGKIKLKNIQNKMIRGLLETEPLHFTSVGTSEGTRVERADTTTGFVQQTQPQQQTQQQQPQPLHSGGTKKIEVEQLVNDFSAVDKLFPSESTTTKYINKTYNNQQYQILIQSDNAKTEFYTEVCKYLQNKVNL